jgi:hypothetical protein
MTRDRIVLPSRMDCLICRCKLGPLDKAVYHNSPSYPNRWLCDEHGDCNPDQLHDLWEVMRDLDGARYAQKSWIEVAESLAEHGCSCDVPREEGVYCYGCEARIAMGREPFPAEGDEDEEDELDLSFGTTERGFTLIEFQDLYGEDCSLQMSSLATEAAIWLGTAGSARRFVPGEGWQDVQLDPNTTVLSRMHLSQAQVPALIRLLQHFADTGDLPQEAP